MNISKILSFVIRKITPPFIYILDNLIPKNKSIWVFPVGPNKQWGGNLKATFDAAKVEEGITPIVLTNSDITEGLNDETKLYEVPTKSISGLKYLLQSSVIVLQYHRTDFFWPGITNRNRIIFNVWHGIPLKGMGFTAKSGYTQKQLDYLNKETDKYDAVVASSDSDCTAMANSFYLPSSRVSIVGLPRNDWLINGLPSDLEVLKHKLKIELRGRKLVLYAPTFRKDNVGIYNFRPNEVKKLDSFLQNHNLALGIRGHVNRNVNVLLEGNNFLNLNHDRYPECHVLLGVADYLITDYSSIWADYILTEKPIIGFCYDWDKYMHDRGLIYDYKQIFPGPITYNTTELMEALEKVLNNNIPDEYKSRYQNTKLMFHKYDDGNSSKRVIDKILELQRLS